MSPARAPLSPERLRQAREKAGFTQHQLARLIDVAGGERISRWELGMSLPRPDVLRRVAEALGVDVVDLLEVPPGGPGLRELRLAAGLTLTGLAREVLVSTRTVHRWEQGDFQRLPTEATIDLLAQALGATEWTVVSALRASRDRNS